MKLVLLLLLGLAACGAEVPHADPYCPQGPWNYPGCQTDVVGLGEANLVVDEHEEQVRLAIAAAEECSGLVGAFADITITVRANVREQCPHTDACAYSAQRRVYTSWSSLPHPPQGARQASARAYLQTLRGGGDGV